MVNHSSLVHIVVLDAHPDEVRLSLIRELFQEYAAFLGFDLGFQDFEKELAGLPGEYAPPHGRLLLALSKEKAAGCAALRRLDRQTCEMKRLYVRPEFRGRGIGRKLASVIVQEGRSAGYHRMRLDSIDTMRQAIGLYRSMGFHEIAPYRYNPIPGALYLEKDLTG